LENILISVIYVKSERKWYHGKGTLTKVKSIIPKKQTSTYTSENNIILYSVGYSIILLISLWKAFNFVMEGL